MYHLVSLIRLDLKQKKCKKHWLLNTEVTFTDRLGHTSFIIFLMLEFTSFFYQNLFINECVKNNLAKISE